MAIKIGANFAYNGKLPNFERDSFETKAAMKAFNENNIDEGHLSYCKEDGNIYQYKSTNAVDATTGKWRIFKTDIVVDATLNSTSKNPIQNKAVFDALKAKADVVALDKYQPKYKADYVAKADFNYSDLPASTNVVDLNGYTMSINKNVTISDKNFYNGNIELLGDGVVVNDSNFFRVDFNEATYYITCNNVLCELCNLWKIRFTGGIYLYYCAISYMTIESATHVDIQCTEIIHTSIGSNITISPAETKIYYSNIQRKKINKGVITNGEVIEVGFESNITTPTLSGNAPSCEAVKDALQLKADKTQLNDLATKESLNNEVNQLVEEINLKLDDTVAASTYLRQDDANNTYAKKSDISNIYKFKGTKTTYADLPTTGVVTGDVWNITNADAEHGIKAGDNVAWNGTAWDNLSGVTDLSGYTTKDTTDAISADVKKLMDKAFPFTVKVSLDKTLAKKGTSQAVKVTITPKIGDDNTNADEIMINGAEYHGTTPYVYSDTATATTTYNVRVRKDSRSAQGSATITFVNPSYDGAVAANFTVTEANIKALTETLRSGKGGTRTFNLNNQKACIAYPKAFGAATAIKDANGFDYLASYTRSEVNVNGELYYVYLLTNATTITDMKQTIS